MTNPTDSLPPDIRDKVQHILDDVVSGGSARFQEGGDRTGSEGQKTISRILRASGIPRTDPRWIAIIEHGRNLYYGRSRELAIHSRPVRPVEPAPLAVPDEGPGSAQDDARREWAALLQRRYVISPRTSTPPVQTDPTCRMDAVRAGHWEVVRWMATQTFRDIVTVHRAVCDKRAAIYFRPTEKGLVRIALHPRAPGYVGFHMRANDEEYLLQTGCPVPTIPEVEAHLRAFETWLPTVRRVSKEEQGVIPWLRTALLNQLRLPDLGEGWVFLHQEWRFLDERGVGKKSDILAVHGPTGQLGIVEFKSGESALEGARQQVESYGRMWKSDSAELAPFFTVLLHAMCAAYGNDSAAATATVSTGPAALFVGSASVQQGVRISRR